MLDSSFLAAPISAHERVGVTLDRLERGLQHAAALIAFRVQATLQAVAFGLAGLDFLPAARSADASRLEKVI